MHAIETAGFSDGQIIGDKRGAVRIENHSQLAVAGYVDNFGVFGISPEHVNSGLSKLSGTLRAWGVTVHEVEEARPEYDFVGLHFNEISGFVSIKLWRLQKIRRAIKELLGSSFAVAESCS